MLYCAQGLILLNATSRQTTILANRVSPTSAKYPGAELIFSDDLDIASDGTVYFSTMTDIPLVKGPTGQYEAMPPCVLNIMQVCALPLTVSMQTRQLSTVLSTYLSASPMGTSGRTWHANMRMQCTACSKCI